MPGGICARCVSGWRACSLKISMPVPGILESVGPAPWGPQVRQRGRAAAEEWTLRAVPRPGARVWVTSVLILRIGVCGGHRSMCRPEVSNLGWRRISVSPHGCPGLCGASVKTLGQFPTRRQVKGAPAWGTWRAKLARPQDKREGGD